jgi:DNA polymerase IV
VTDGAEIRATITAMADGAAMWLERVGHVARTVTIKVRYNDFTTITRSHTAPPTRDATAIRLRAVTLIDRTEAGARPVRLLGVSVHNLSDGNEAIPVPEREPRLPFEPNEDHA